MESVSELEEDLGYSKYDYKNKDKIEEVVEIPKPQVKQTKVRKGGKW